jgi:hypothetical protein
MIQTKASGPILVLFGLMVMNAFRILSGGTYLIVAALLLDSMASALTSGFGSDKIEDASQWSKFCPVYLVPVDLTLGCRHHKHTPFPFL